MARGARLATQPTRAGGLNATALAQSAVDPRDNRIAQKLHLSMTREVRGA